MGLLILCVRLCVFGVTVLSVFLTHHRFYVVFYGSMYYRNCSRLGDVDVMVSLFERS